MRYCALLFGPCTNPHLKEESLPHQPEERPCLHRPAVHTHAHTHTHTHRHEHARTHTRAHTHARTHRHAHARTHTHTCAHGRTHAHTRTHTHTHTHTQLRNVLRLKKKKKHSKCVNTTPYFFGSEGLGLLLRNIKPKHISKQHGDKLAIIKYIINLWPKPSHHDNDVQVHLKKNWIWWNS